MFAADSRAAGGGTFSASRSAQAKSRKCTQESRSAQAPKVVHSASKDQPRRDRSTLIHAKARRRPRPEKVSATKFGLEWFTFTTAIPFMQGRCVDVVAILSNRAATHEMLCRAAFRAGSIIGCDAEKNYFECARVLPLRIFALLYSGIRVKTKIGHANNVALNAGSLSTTAYEFCSLDILKATSIPLNRNAEGAGTNPWRKFLTAVRTRWLDSVWF